MARMTLLSSERCYATQAYCRRTPFLVFRLGQRMWLSTRDPSLQVESIKLVPRFVGPFSIQRVISLAAVRLQLPFMRVHIPHLQSEASP